MKESSIYRLLTENKNKCKSDCLREVLFGDGGLGGMLEKQGKTTYGAVPSPSIKKPLGCTTTNPRIDGLQGYFSGGHTIRTHGTSNNLKAKVDAIQIEVSKANSLKIF